MKSDNIFFYVTVLNHSVTNAQACKTSFLAVDVFLDLCMKYKMQVNKTDIEAKPDFFKSNLEFCVNFFRC